MEKNKTGKYLKYAFGEIVLVVIGILIALQINNWNERLKDRTLEELYIDRFLDDLEEEGAYVQSFIDYNLKVYDYAKKAVQHFEFPEIAMRNPQQSLLDLYQASQFSDARTTASTYKELNASGQINLLKNFKLRSSLISYYELNWTNSVVLNIPNNYRESVRSFMPSNIQEKIRTNCGDIYIETKNSIAIELPDNCEIDIENEIAKITLKNLLNKEQVNNDLNFLIGNMESKLRYMDYVQKQVKEVVKKLKKEKY